MNVEAVFDAATDAINHVRKGDGPYLLECLTYRYYGHSRSDAAPYRTKEEEKVWKKRDPIVNYQGLLAERGTLASDECEKMQKEIDLSLDDAVAFADASAFPSVNEIFADIYAD
jgi:pyruvate dehydrogenase E1 component alpha subunit